MKKILYISAFPPNKNTAGQNFSRQLISKLSKKSQLDLIYFSYNNHELDNKIKVNKIKRINNNLFTKLLNAILFPVFHPFFTCRFNWFLLYELIVNKNNYDLVFFDFSQIHLYSYFIKHSQKVLLCHDIIQQKFSRSNGKFESLIVSFSEKHILKRAKNIFTFSKKDSNLLNKLYNVKSQNINFFLDKAILDIKYVDIKVENFFIMYGAWNRKENYEGLDWFIYNVLPYLGDIHIKIIGPKMPASLINKINNIKSINYIGFVDNPYKVISKAKALIAPVFSGAGVKVKVIESLSLGVEVIGTEIAFEGIEFYNKNLECNTDKDFILCLNKLKKIEINTKTRKDKKIFFHNNYKENIIVDLLLKDNLV